ncbi:MAG: glycerate kinase [Alistipes sp.]|nr:glycerate kinase [Alistipes sp.]
MKRVVVALDSFKGSLDSYDAGKAFAEGIRDVVPEADVRHYAIADGGEGFSEAIALAKGGDCVKAMVCDPLMRPIEASYTILGKESRAVIAMSSASGLPLLTAQERNPLVATTYGTGQLIADAIERGCRHIVVGLGGSATNDCGVGMLRALGCRFYDAKGNELTETIEVLERVAEVQDDETKSRFRGVEFSVAVDVDNPLCGERGAAYIYAPQKGADGAMVERLDRAMRHFASVVDRGCGYRASDISGVGAAGGLGYAFVALLGATLKSGIELVLDAIGFDEALIEECLVVTGEGRIDAQTLMGKAPSGVLRRAMLAGRVCVAVGGSIVECEQLTHSTFAKTYAITPQGMPLAEAMLPDVARHNLRTTAHLVAKEFLI